VNISSSILPEIRSGSLEVKISRDPQEIYAAQQLRYQIFFGEMGGVATHPQVIAEQRDFDEFDEVCDHLLVIDHRRTPLQGKIVGCYRLLRKSAMPRIGRFYTASEFDVSPLLRIEEETMELGRSCVHPDYRNRSVIQLLWRGIGEYAALYKVALLFGCASFSGVDATPYREALSYLYYTHLAPPEYRITARAEQYQPMDLLPKEMVTLRGALNAMPPLIKGYLRLNAFVSEGAFRDTVCQSIDVGIILKTTLITGKYLQKYHGNISDAEA
jgi:putative hemolysin